MEELFTLGELYPSNFIDGDTSIWDKKYELKLVYDEQRDAVRLEKSAPLDKMYGQYWYRSGINQTMRNELKDIVESINKLIKLKENDVWLDIACFPEGNFINTINGNIDIKNIKVGDYVLSHDKKYHKVIKLFKREFEGEFIKLKIKKLNLETKSTFNHKFLTKRGWIKAKNLIIGDKIKTGYYSNYNDDEYLNLYEILKKCHPFDIIDLNDGYIISKSNGLKSKLPKTIKLDDDLIKIFAYYIGEGSSSGESGIQFTFNITEIDKAHTIKNYFEKIFNINVEIIIRGKTLYVRLHSRLLSSIFKYLCGYTSFNKTIPQLILINNKMSIFLESLWFTDGHVTMHRNRHGKYKKDYVFSSVSKKLILDIWNILKSYNINCSIQCVKNNRGFGINLNNYIYKITVNINNSVHKLENIFNNINTTEKHILKNNDDDYVEILDIQNMFEKHTVYNFEVEESNTYVCNGLIVHNCNDGTLLSFVRKNTIRIGVDPCDDSYLNESKNHSDVIIQDFFSKDSYRDTKYGHLKAKIVTTIAMFYDLEEPEKFLKDVYDVMDDDGLFVLQLSYTPLMIKQLAFDNICHEHIYYYSLYNIKNLFEKNGFKLMDCQLNDVNGGSFRVYFMKDKSDINNFYTKPYRDVCEFRINSILEYEKSLKLSEKQTWLDFFNRINQLKEKTYNFIKLEKEKGKTIWGYGASTKGNTTLQYFGLDNTLIDGIAERSKYKWGLKTVGTNIPIYSEDEMRKKKPDYVLVLPWHFIDEFVKRESEYLDNGGQFIVPCPEFKIIKK